MSRRSSHPLRAPRRPHFYWQGTLIVLPALILAGAGFSALRQDRALAEHDARAQAMKLAADLVRDFPAALLREDAALPSTESLAGGARNGDGTNPLYLKTPGDDPVFRGALHTPKRLLYAISDREGFVYPPSPLPLPVPTPLDPGQLDSAQRSAWERFAESWQGSVDAEAIAGRLQGVLATAPPPRFAGIALYRAAQILSRQGKSKEAVPLLRRALSDFPDELAESGEPLRLLAQISLLPLLPESEQVEILNTVGARLVATPDPVALQLLRRLAETFPAAAPWLDLLERHDDARRFFVRCAARSDGGPILWEEHRFWPLEQKVGGGRWIVGVSVDEADQAAAGFLLQQHLPVEFRAQLTLGPGGARRDDIAEVAATSTGALAAAGEAVPLMARVSLADPAAFYARQHARTMRFGALILLSAGAVLIGFVTAWRAFRRQQQLSEMKSNFVSSVSHELRAPIASVRLMAEELQAAPDASPDKARQYHQFIQQECRRLSAVIENVLDFSRAEQGREHFEFAPLDPGALLEETVGAMRAYAGERQVLLELLPHADSPSIVADARALGRVLVNLLDNAIKHSPPGATVTVGQEFSGDRFRFWVEDHGPGIPPAEHARIFERFYRIGSEIRRETPGIGLGLSIVHRLVAIHGGEVHVRSAAGAGSRFTVDLPCLPPALEPGRGSNGKSPPSPSP